MRTKSRAQVAADRAKGTRPRKDAQPKVYSGPLVARYGDFTVKPMRLLDTFTPGRVTQVARSAYPKGLPGDDMRRKFALRGQRDLDLSKAYTEAEVNAILAKYGDLA